MKAFKYNETKALNWLALKCKKLANAFKERNFHIGAKSLNYVKSEKTDNNKMQNGNYLELDQNQIVHNPSNRSCFVFFHIESEFLSYAFGIVSDYITLDLSEKLCEHLGLEKVKAAVSGKRKSLVELENNTLKRVKSEEDFSAAHMETMSPPQLATIREKKVSAKDMKMAKAASGTKSISSFFSKK